MELSFELDKTPSKGVPPEIDRLNAALRKSPIALHVQRLVPLSKGGQLKRYEVLLRSGPEAAQNVAPQAMLKSAVENGLGSMIDRRVISELIGWLVRHPEIWQANEVMFSVNLTTTALHDEHFIKFIELCLAKSSLPKGTIAFEVDAATALNLSDKISEVATALHRLGCPLILDDFKLRTECFELMRLPGSPLRGACARDHRENAHRQGIPSRHHGGCTDGPRAGHAHLRQANRKFGGTGVADRSRRRLRAIKCRLAPGFDRNLGEGLSQDLGPPKARAMLI